MVPKTSSLKRIPQATYTINTHVYNPKREGRNCIAETCRTGRVGWHPLADPVSRINLDSYYMGRGLSMIIILMFNNKGGKSYGKARLQILRR